MNGLKVKSRKNISDFYSVKKNLLQKSQNFFSASNSLVLQIGVELEFYLIKDRDFIRNSNDQTSSYAESASTEEVEIFISLLENFFSTKKAVYKIEKERGEGQIEVKILPQTDLVLLCQLIEEIKSAAKNLAKNLGLIACFEAQIFAEDCGSALQFNFSLHDKNGANLFVARKECFFATIAGMLDSIELAMIFYAPEEKDYLRFNLETNCNLHKKGKFSAPTNISFGDNNRTVAVRVVSEKNKDKESARIEFRVASANADCYLSISALIISIANAISKNAIPESSWKIFGNAFDSQYQLKKLPQNLQTAQDLFWQKENFIREFLQRN